MNADKLLANLNSIIDANGSSPSTWQISFEDPESGTIHPVVNLHVDPSDCKITLETEK